MSTLPAREFRHNLRTPVNHILGYGELLLEDARDLSRGELVGDLEQILAAAREALAVINQAGSEAQLAGLCERLCAPAQRIAALARSLQAQSGEAGAADLEKIRMAAETLMGMVRQAAPPAADGPARDAGEREPRAASGERARLLVVDDNETNRHVLRRRLERQGHAVEEAADGARALALLRSGTFDLVLLDIVMPVMDGFEVLAEMKADTALADVPVIVISALDEMNSVVRAIEMGAADYLSKPFDPVLLRARIAATLETRRLRNELVVREKLASLGELTAGVAHEIKNPLNFVNNFADLALELVGELREKLPPGEALELAGDLERNVAKIKEHGMRADSVVRSMLLHARTGAGERRATDLNALVDESVRLAWHGARAQDPSSGIGLETDYDPGVGEVRVIPQDLSRVILNITANALYAARGRVRPVVRAATRNLGGRVEIRISDNGPGIPREHRGRIFDPFFTTKPAGEGAGLGLSLAYDIVVRGHQGEIRVESEEGQGAEFIVTLPRQ